MELVILGIGLDTGIISSSVFSMMVIMALSTTTNDRSYASVFLQARSVLPVFRHWVRANIH